MGEPPIVGEVEVVERESVAAPQRLLTTEQKPPIPTLKIRVREDSGSVVQVFHKGHTPGHVDVGDRLRIRGVRRHGVLHAEQIFNETTGSWVNERGRCFIATAATSELSPEVQTLSRFRDRHLRTSRLGHWLIRQYERHSPACASFIRRHGIVRHFVRVALVRPIAAMLDQAEGGES